MRLSFPATALVLLLALSAAPVSWGATPAAPAPKRSTPAARAHTGMSAPAALPDSFAIARVGDRAISVLAYRANWYASDPQLRPETDSLGRVSFLQDLVNKDILGLTALKLNRPLSFEDRANLRNFGNEILSNILYQHTVKDSSDISEDSLRHVYQFYGRELKLRILYFGDRQQAEFTRQQLISGRLLWSVALVRWGVNSKTVHHGLSGWMKFQSLPVEIALQIWPLRVGETSGIILAESGYHLVQPIDSRPTATASYAGLHKVIKITMHGVESTARKERIQAQAKVGMDVVYDTTNVKWAAAHFHDAVHVESEGLGTSINVDENVPQFEPQDGARVLATWKGGTLTVAKMLSEYTGMVPVTRPSVTTPERMLTFIDALILAPRMVQFAIERGYDKEPLYLAQFARRREAILVEHMVDDSVLSKITVSKEERREYYDKNPDRFTSFPEVRFAVLVRDSRAAADSVRAQIAAGTPVDSLVAWDVRHGVVGSGTSSINSQSDSPFRKVIFAELRPGKTTIIGPDSKKQFAVLYEYSYDPGKLLPYEQMEGTIDESVRNIKGDAAMRAFIARHAGEYAIESHPELVMRINLTDPESEAEHRDE